MSITRVKICGITRPEDAALAAELGADAIGLNFFAGPRKISVDRAVEILAEIPPLITPVALTSGPTTEFPDAPSIEEIQTGPTTGGRTPLRIHTFQFYGRSDFFAGPAPWRFCALWTVCGIGPGNVAAQLATHFAALSFHTGTVVIDAVSSTGLGGSGNTLDWHAVGEAAAVCMQKELFHRFILAGGLTPSNVAQAIRIAHPYAVDVSSGVEVAGKPGLKDPIKMRDFIQAAKSA